jgi:hypothetical protein
MSALAELGRRQDVAARMVPDEAARGHPPERTQCLARELDWYDQRGILVSVDATRAAEEVGHCSS